MKISIIGTGYVGLTSALCFASKGHQVICHDKDITKINQLNQKIPTIFEQGLPELLSEMIEKKSIEFTNNIEYAVKNSEVIILAVGTPQASNGQADLSYIYECAKQSAKFVDKYKLFITKSTVSVGTNYEIKKIIEEIANIKIDVASNPEFMREGFALDDFFHPDRIVIGCETTIAKNLCQELYQPWLIENYPILFTDIKTAELIKYACNAFLMTKVAFINEIENLANKIGANISDISKGMGMDNRIGTAFLNPGPGIGGSCFPKDSLALSFIANQHQIDLAILNQVIKSNNQRFIDSANRIIDFANSVDPQQKNISILGLAFKAGTDDIRQSPAIEIIKILVKNGFKINVFDPQALENTKKTLIDKIYQDNIFYHDNLLDCYEKNQIIAILTEWQEFKQITGFKDFSNKKIIDLRRLILK
jgi:UDPglucose 6-dehydrogenase